MKKRTLPGTKLLAVGAAAVLYLSVGNASADQGYCGPGTNVFSILMKAAAIPQGFPSNDPLITGDPIIGLVAAHDECTILGVASFQNSCKNHDACYTKSGNSKAACDRNFQAELNRACDNAYATAAKVEMALDPFHAFPHPNEVCLGFCRGTTALMHTAVVNLGGSAYEAAQATNFTWMVPTVFSR